MPDNPQPPTVALLGTGIMGAGMGRNMLRAGLPVRAWNRTADKARALEPDGVQVAQSPADAVRGAHVIVTMLPSTDVIAEVMEQAADGLIPGQAWAQTSTVGVTGIEQLAAFARKQDLALVDAPVLGTRGPAESGALIVFAAGPAEAKQRVQRVFDAIGRKTIWLDAVGAPSRLKLVCNNWVLAVTGATAETVALAEGLGADARVFLDLMSGGPLDCDYMRIKAEAILKGDYEPNFAVDMAGKDADLIVAASQAAGLRQDMAEAVSRRLRRAAETGHAHQDMAANYFASFED
jgi:3-hydroxyisobutyrate dehydrogenase